MSGPLFKVAVAQAASIAFDREQTLMKVKALAGEAAALDAKIVLFPEAFVSAYPRGLCSGAVVGARSDKGRQEYQRYWESSVDNPGAATEQLGRIARSIGVTTVGLMGHEDKMLRAAFCSLR